MDVVVINHTEVPEPWPAGQVDPKFLSTMTYAENIIVGVTLVLIGVFSIAVNIFFLVTLRGYERRLKPVEFFMTHLSVSYLLLTLIAFPLPVTACFKGYWIFGDVGCRGYAFYVYFVGLVGMGALTVMSVVIYVKTCLRRFRGKITGQSLLYMMMFVYAKAGLWAVFPFMGWGTYGPEEPGIYCGLDWLHMSHSYLMALTVVWLFIPLLVMCYCYGALIITLKSSRFKATMRHRASMNHNHAPVIGKLIRISLYLCSGFLIAWTPYTVLSFWQAYGDPRQIPHSTFLRVSPALFAKATTIFNPLIYVIYNCGGNQDRERGVEDNANLHANDVPMSLPIQPVHTIHSPTTDVIRVDEIMLTEMDGENYPTAAGVNQNAEQEITV